MRRTHAILAFVFVTIFLPTLRADEVPSAPKAPPRVAVQEEARKKPPRGTMFSRGFVRSRCHSTIPHGARARG